MGHCPFPTRRSQTQVSAAASQSSAKSKDVRYLVFDVESVADGDLVNRIRYPNMGYSPAEAIQVYQDELTENHGTTFIPHTFQLPVAVVVAKVAGDGTLLDLVSLDEPDFRPHQMVHDFWKGWDAYDCPTWVTFNGRGFDLPIMELAAFRYGIPLQKWFGGNGYNAPRNRFNRESHLDLQEFFTNFGATRCHGGLNVIANLINKPGKVGLKGDQVQEQYNLGNHIGISNYCRCDVLDTYFVFLRSQTLTGKWPLEHEEKLVADAKVWLEDRLDTCDAYGEYMEHWEEWISPWPRSG